jgi:hypothetical protein
VGGEIIQAICFSVILFSTMFSVFLFFLIHKDVSLPFYELIYGKDKEPDQIVDPTLP